MPETIIKSVLTGKLDSALLFKWLNNESIEDIPEDCVLFCCNRNEFVAYFLSYLRNQTDSILQTNSNAPPPLHQTPEKVHNSQRKHHRSISDPTSDDRKDTLTVKSQSMRSQESPSKDRKRTGKRVKTKLFSEEKNQSVSSDESRLSIGLDRVVISSTPMKNGLKLSDYPNLASPVSLKEVSTPQRSFKEIERCDTPRLSTSHGSRHKSHEKSCLGDYIVSAQKSSKKKKSRNASDDSEPKTDLDLSNSDVFPEIGARKASSLRSDKRRIKPTNIDQNTSRKSLSLNSFNSDCFQQPSPLALEENAAFKQQNTTPKESTNSFDAERSMLKLERHKLMEKFNILNTASSPKPVTPQIKITQKESFEKASNIINADFSKILFKEKLDILVEIYDVLINKNLILSVNTEIYFLISILLSKQVEDDFINAEINLKDNNYDFLLKSIHNSTYLAVKCLWNLRVILEVVLDKNSLKILGENKKVRAFHADLAKFLLNSYGLKCEMETSQERKMENRPSNGVICFNHETDNVENFPSALSFHNFKKQRDMFYEIVRWYQETQTTGASRSSFRARVKTLLSAGVTAANFSHLAALFTQHMLAECLPANTQESKLSKLHRRLTCPNAESHRLPAFTAKELFYKDFILSTDHESFRVHLRDAITKLAFSSSSESKLSKLHRRLTCPNAESHRLPAFTAKELFYKDFILSTDHESFRVHLRDALAAELVNLDSTPIDPNTEVSKEYHQLAKKLALVSKFLGFLTALPYTLAAEPATKAPLPRERAHLENNLVLRNYNQPSIDLKGLLSTAYETSHLVITVPWLVHYLSMLDYTTLRIRYYQALLRTLRYIYVHRLTLSDSVLRKTTVIFLKCCLGWLFDLPHFPQEITDEKIVYVQKSEVNLDSFDIIDEVILFDLCPYLRDVNVLLSTCKVSHEQKDVGSFRHITPVSLTLNPEDRLRNKERELQARLEEEMLKSQPSSSRRVLELVTERVCASTVRDLARALAAARAAAAAAAGRAVRDRQGSQAVLLQQLQALYADHFHQLRSSALESSSTSIRRRTSSALQALLPNAPKPLQALAANNCVNRLRKWINDNWSGPAILCKDIEGEMKNFLAVGESVAPKKSDSGSLRIDKVEWAARASSPAACLIHLKEQICLLLDDEEPTDLPQILSTCVACCNPNNVFNRPPTQRAILQLSVDLCVVYVSRKPQHITDAFLNQLHLIWNICCPDRKMPPPEELTIPERRPNLSPDFRKFVEEDRAPTPVSDEESSPVIVKIVNDVKIVNEVKIETDSQIASELDPKVNSEKSERDENLEFFDRILCPRNIVLLNSTKCKPTDVWEALATVLVFLLTNAYLSEDSLTEQCLAVYRQDWPQSILENLSTCMKSVSSRWSRSSTGKFTLFLDFLAEYCGDMDYEPLD